ncbi:MAG: PTS sugar transporter subunit IIC [Deltaproteobacteria bacterium]|nr:PTS sugar transporter subunit IIC [Deltaproteobacteria bacterium]
MISQALVASAVGSLLWLDRFQMLQLMVSRPVVAAPLVGWLVGDLGAGLASGILFELLWLRQPPVGGYIPPDTTLASVAGAAISGIVRTQHDIPVTSLALMVFLCALPVAFLGMVLDAALRNGLTRLARRANLAAEQLNGCGAWRSIVGGLILGFSLAFLALFPIIIVGALFIGQLVKVLPAGLAPALGFAFYAALLVAVADCMVGHEEKAGVLLFLLGFGIILIGGLIFGVLT